MAPHDRDFNRGGGGRPPHQGGQRSSGYGERPPDKTLDELWPDYLTGGYFDTDGNLRRELVSRAKIELLVKALATADTPLTSSQARRFFMHCRAIEAQIKAHKTTWQQQEAEFLKLDIAAVDAFGKTPRKVPKLFHDFIRRNVEAVRNEKDFLKGFLPHFEALIGFGSLHLKERERN